MISEADVDDGDWDLLFNFEEEPKPNDLFKFSDNLHFNNNDVAYTLTDLYCLKDDIECTTRTSNYASTADSNNSNDNNYNSNTNDNNFHNFNEYQNIDSKQQFSNNQSSEMRIQNQFFFFPNEEQYEEMSGTCNENIKDMVKTSKMEIYFENDYDYSSILTPLSCITSVPDSFLVSAKERLRTKKDFVFQNPREPRITYLIRCPYLWAEYLNSGDLNKFKVFLEDILTDDCMCHMVTSPHFEGRERIYSSYLTILRKSPDFYVLFSSVKRIKKRIISFNCNSYGTLPFKDSQEFSPTLYNFFGSTLHGLDDFHKEQKQKFDLLRSQNKVIKFERKTNWNFMLNREVNKVCKVMAKTTRLEIFEA